MSTKETKSIVTTVVAADLVAAIVMRGIGNGISGTRQGHSLTQTVVASAACNVIREEAERSYTPIK